MTRPFFSCGIAALLWAPMLVSGQPSPPLQTADSAVNVDVVVLDLQHKPVHKLTASDFVVLEDGHPQTIGTFEEHNSWEAATPVMQAPELPPGTFTNFSIAPAGGATNVLLLDLLNTPAEAQSAVRDEMLKYLKEVHPGTRMAIFGLTSKLVLLQGFTSDVELLSDVVRNRIGALKLAEAANDSTLDGSGGEAPADNKPAPDDSDEPSASLGNTPSASELVAGVKQLEAVTQSTPRTVRAHYTLDALNLLAHSLSNLRGRKNLIWFSGSFPINILPDGDEENPFGVLASAVDEYRETTALLAQSKVAVYPIEATAGVKAKDDPSVPSGSAKSIMQAMAQATGGEVVADAGGIQAAVDRAIETGSHYYALSYTPTERKTGDGYRKIRVDTSRPGLTLEYRRGYFVDGASTTVHSGQAPGLGTSNVVFNGLRIAMGRGGPDPTEIIFTASAIPVAGEPEPEVAPGNKIGDRPQGPFRRYAIQLGIDAHDLTCPTNADGAYQCTLEAAMTVYDADGTAINSAGGMVQATIPANQFANILRDGLLFRQDLSVPVKGDWFVRIGVHEQSTNKLGAVEFPVLAVSKLKPIPVTPAANKSPSAARP